MKMHMCGTRVPSSIASNLPLMIKILSFHRDVMLSAKVAVLHTMLHKNSFFHFSSHSFLLGGFLNCFNT